MRTSSARLAAVAALALAAACSTPARRIRAHQDAFDSYPPAVQEKIRAGQVDVGFTHDMVLLALGRPDRRYERKSASGSQEVWSYRDVSPGLGLSLGAATGVGVGYAGGVMVDGPQAEDERARVVFDGDRVASVESRKR